MAKTDNTKTIDQELRLAVYARTEAQDLVIRYLNAVDSLSTRIDVLLERRLARIDHADQMT